MKRKDKNKENEKRMGKKKEKKNIYIYMSYPLCIRERESPWRHPFKASCMVMILGSLSLPTSHILYNVRIYRSRST